MSSSHPVDLPNDLLQHPHWLLVERVASSRLFQSSVRLRDFLLYVSACALRGAPEEATEQHIGIHVFQRAPGFNASDDSIVRTHARLLRQKLVEYFQSDGIDEELIVEVPKGHYLPTFRPRVIQSEPNPAPPAEAAPTFMPAAYTIRFSRPGLIALIALVGAAGFGAAWWLRPAVHHAPGESEMRRLWGPFWTDNPPLLIYSNALFEGDSTNGLRYAPSGQNPGSNGAQRGLVDTYTGVGELNAVYDLTRLFDDNGAVFTLKRSLLVTWDEAKQENLIFIGSVAENPALRVMPGAMDFTLMAGNGFAGIVNHHPRPGELALYSRPELPLTKDYAIIALMPGLEPDRKILIFSGLMTLGTQAAVDFACHPDTMDQLVRAASGPSGAVRPFEAVIETTLGGDVPLQSKLVTIHVH